MQFNEAVNWLKNIRKFNLKQYDLTAINCLLDELNRPHLKLKYVHIAGTNGKGSVAKFCSEALVEYGEKTGLFISPHVLNLNERIQINGEPISNVDFVYLIERLKPVVERLADCGVYCSQFDVITASAFLYFYLKKCSFVVLETGMGGRLDSTNVILKPEIAVITKIGLDHMKELGSSLEQIAFEKAGIIKPGCVCVCSAFEPPQVLDILKKICLEKKAKLVLSYKAEKIRLGYRNNSFYFKGENYTTKLCGTFQVENAMLALTALLELGVPSKSIKIAFERTFWPARFEVFGNNPKIVLDGAHNVDGVKLLFHSLKCLQSGPVVGVLSMLLRKNYVQVLKELKNVELSNLVLTQMDSTEVACVEELACHAKDLKLNFGVEPNVAKALELAKTKAVKNGVVVVFGSLYFVAQVRKMLIT